MSYIDEYKSVELLVEFVNSHPVLSAAIKDLFQDASKKKQKPHKLNNRLADIYYVAVIKKYKESPDSRDQFLNDRAKYMFIGHFSSAYEEK